MHSLNRENDTKQNDTKRWIRFALKCGLLATDARVWTVIHRLLNERDLSGRRTAVEPRWPRNASRADTRRISPSTALLGGVGIGIGLGLLLAPVSGAQTRSVIRVKTLDVRDTVGRAADWLRSARYRTSPDTYGY